jgi:DnaJ-class molecular chaperone
MNFYTILNVDKSASQDEIKQSYKKLVLKYHPDKGGDEEQFKMIQEAYETLSDPEKRSLYDTPKNNVFEININNHFVNIIRQLYKPAKRIDITTTFEELYLNFSKEIELPYNIKLNFPLYQTKLQVQGEPDNYVICNQITHIPENFQIVNNVDLLITLHINFYESLAGKTFQINLPLETLNFKKMPIIKDHDIFVIKNKGILKNSSGERGNLLLRFDLLYPTLTDEKLKILQKCILNS